MKNVSQFIYIIVIAAFLFGCGSQNQIDNANPSNNEYVNGDETVALNGKHTLALTPNNEIAIYAFNMQEKGYINLDASWVSCDTKLINSDGRVLSKITSSGAINPELEQGKYYITIEAKSSQCDSFELFSPKITDNYTNTNEKVITNGLHSVMGKMDIVVFNMQEKGYVNLDANWISCDTKLINSDGRVLSKITSNGAINPELEQGKYYITIEAISTQCENYELFSPKILDEYTDGSQENITNGNHNL